VFNFTIKNNECSLSATVIFFNYTFHSPRVIIFRDGYVSHHLLPWLLEKLLAEERSPRSSRGENIASDKTCSIMAKLTSLK
jgi:hypothetical protein